MKEILAGVYKPNRTAVMVVFLSSNKLKKQKNENILRGAHNISSCTKARNMRNCVKDQSEATQVNFRNEFNCAGRTVSLKFSICP